MTDKNIDDQIEKQQDGFDAIEYPLDFAFKAVCETALTETALIDSLQSSIKEKSAHLTVKSTSTKSSSSGKYTSVTLTVGLEGRNDLESVYAALVDNTEVKMTL